MSVIGSNILAGASGSAAGEALYVDDVFSTYVYEGTGSTQTITNGIDLAGEGGLVWFKVRDAADSHTLQDSERKTGTYHDDLGSDSSNYSETSRPWGISSMNSDGFTIGGSNTQINNSSNEYAAWTFRKAPGFFDCVTWVGDGVAGRTVAHNLGSQPGMIFVKKTNSTGNWSVYHRSLGATKNLLLNLTNAEGTSSTQWNDTEPTSTEFTVGSSSLVNASGSSYVAYLFAHDDQSFGTDSDESVIKCGTFTTDSTGKATVNLGWEPQFALIKRTDSSQSWYVVDTMRDWITTTGSTFSNFLRAESSNAEQNGITSSPTSSGFSIDITSSATYVYMAIRRPHKPPSAGTEVFDVQTSADDGGSGTLTSTSVTADLTITAVRSSGWDKWAATRILGNTQLLTISSSAASSSYSQWSLDEQYGFRHTSFTASNSIVDYTFRRAPGFLDCLAYEGTGSVQTVPHGLGVAPELLLVRRLTGVGYLVYSADYGASGYGVLAENFAFDTGYWGSGSGMWNNTDPTSSVFTLGSNNATNVSGGDYVAYLFASLDGISKVGSYSGTGSDINVDCGFTAGARFVLIKRTDSSGDWYAWDTARGIIAGNDPYTLFNTTDAEVTSNDYIDPLNAGFTVTSTAPAGLNASGGTYIFLAIA